MLHGFNSFFVSVLVGGVLQAAINYCVKSQVLRQAVYVTEMPEGDTKKERWLTRNEAARLLRQSRREHMGVADFVMVGLYTGWRKQAILGLQWQANTAMCWIDLENERMHRPAAKGRKTETIPIPARLISHLKRIRKRTRQYVIEWEGKPLANMRRSWATAAKRAGLGKDVTPHTMRHTAVTWRLQRGISTWDVAGFVGMSERMVKDRYGHHCPDFMTKAKEAY